jgi:hypothetical protein
VARAFPLFPNTEATVPNSTKINELMALVASKVSWQSDVGIIIAGPFLEALIVLASRARIDAKDAFLERWSHDD